MLSLGCSLSLVPSDSPAEVAAEYPSLDENPMLSLGCSLSKLTSQCLPLVGIPAMVASEFLTSVAHPALVVSYFRIPMRYPTTVAVESLTLVKDTLQVSVWVA